MLDVKSKLKKKDRDLQYKLHQYLILFAMLLIGDLMAILQRPSEARVTMDGIPSQNFYVMIMIFIVAKILLSGIFESPRII
jgi:hypothetical protein